MSDGIVLIDKPTGWTSFDVVAKIRGKIRSGYSEKGIKPTKRQLRVGHAGTLDPFASGLLVVLVGDDCKKAGDLLKLDKVYRTVIHLGKTSTTGDPEGEVTSVSDAVPTKSEVVEVLKSFVGEIVQTPPIYSAIKVNGQRAYKLAREGKPVDIPKRTVSVHSIELVDYTYPNLTILAHVGSGTYIRTLAQDIGTALGTSAYCSELRRMRVGEWDIQSAHTVDEYIASI